MRNYWERGPCPRGSLRDRSLSLNAISKHVKVLEGAGLVHRFRHGREHVLCLNAVPLREVTRWASRYERYWNERLDRLEAFFTERKKRS